MNRIESGLLIFAAVSASGCAESVVLAGNGASFLVATLLLWSTVNIHRRSDEQRG